MEGLHTTGGLGMRIDYPWRRNGKITEYEIDGEWGSISYHAKRYGATRLQVRKAIRRGRPPNVSHLAVRVVGGPWDGEWLKTSEIAKRLRVNRSWPLRRLYEIDGIRCFEWEEPDRVQQKRSIEGAKNAKRPTPNKGRRLRNDGWIVFQDRGDRDLANFASMGW